MRVSPRGSCRTRIRPMGRPCSPCRRCTYRAGSGSSGSHLRGPHRKSHDRSPRHCDSFPRCSSSPRRRTHTGRACLPRTRGPRGTRRAGCSRCDPSRPPIDTRSELWLRSRCLFDTGRRRRWSDAAPQVDPRAGSMSDSRRRDGAASRIPSSRSGRPSRPCSRRRTCSPRGTIHRPAEPSATRTRFHAQRWRASTFRWCGLDCRHQRPASWAPALACRPRQAR